ncbi:unnamed protein product [Penicillium glandicola]
MSHLFCCTSIQPTKLPNPEHEKTFTEFTKWALTTLGNLNGSTDPSETSLCVQLVRQVHSGPVESVRYFVASDKHGNFEEVSEDGILDANFVKINECKTVRCSQHNRDFDLNIYEPSTGSSRHWKANITKPRKQLENAIKNKISGSGSGSMSGSGSGSRSVLGSMGSGVGHRASSSYGYGSGMGYGSAWGTSLGSGCGPNWGTGSTVFDKHVPSSTTIETGFSDSDEQDQDQDQYQEGVSQGDGIEYTNQDDDKDQLMSSSPTLDTEVTQDEDEGLYSPHFETLVTSHESVSQSYLDVEDYGCYFSGSSDDYGSYDCGGDNDVTYEQDCGDCGDCDY